MFSLVRIAIYFDGRGLLHLSRQDSEGKLVVVAAAA